MPESPMIIDNIIVKFDSGNKFIVLKRTEIKPKMVWVLVDSI